MLSSFVRKTWSTPSINFSLRVFSALLLIILIALISGEVNYAVMALMGVPSTLISGLDIAGPRRWTRFLISSVVWTGALLVSYLMLSYAIPLWITYGVLSILAAGCALNGPFWGRLGVSSLLTTAMALSLYNSKADIYSYLMLVLGSLGFALFSWAWFALWKHYALKVGLIAIYDQLNVFFKHRTQFLLGEGIEKKAIETKYQLIELFEQAVQSESFLLSKNDINSLKKELFLASDIFEGLISCHTRNKDLISQFQHDEKKRHLLMKWSENCQQRLLCKAKVLQNSQVTLPTESCIAIADELIEAVQAELNHQTGFHYWAASIKYLSRRIELEQPSFERKIEIQPFELAWHLPKKNNPIWRHVARFSLIFTLGAVIADSFRLAHPEWVFISIIVVIQPSFSSTRSKIWQRWLGTGSGLLFATVLISCGPSALQIYILLTILLVVAILNMIKNYAVTIGCTTAMMVLVPQVVANNGIDIVVPRMIDNLIGCSLVLVGYSVLWPQWRGKEIHAQSIKALQASKTLFLMCYEELQSESNKIEPTQFGKKRLDMLSKERGLELIYNEMQNEPRFTRRDPQYYEEMLSHYRLLSYYLCLLIPLARNGTTIHSLTDWEGTINRAMDALISSIQGEKVIELPYFDETNIPMTSGKPTNEQAAYELVWLSLMAVKQMHDLVRDKYSQVAS
ncbi:FUSC family protein [Photobacterium angustum]|uniref:FUSC family protein n=1 Tax=Photobacterium angustum TaxID=661 RepID=A0A2S7VKX8_PHOAN|nr:FUSC family protein [Photobacterium angustum]PQJ62310.1 FUSC family protein [Photobacterium angustum]